MSKRRYLSVPYVVWIIGFTILPLIMIVVNAFGNGSGQFTLENVLAIFEPVHRKAFLLSLVLALVCTVICLVLAYPLALVLRKLNFGRKGFVIMVVILPMWMNFVLRIMALQTILAENGILNMILTTLGLPKQGFSNSMVAVVIGMVYDFLPFMILPIYNAIMEIKEDVIEAARDLGASQKKVITKIMLPLSFPGIASGITMVFVPSLTTFAISDIMGGGKVYLIGNIIEQEFVTTMNWNLGSGLSIALMVFVLISMLFTMKNDKEGSGKVVW